MGFDTALPPGAAAGFKFPLRSLVLQRDGDRGDSPAVPAYGGEFIAQSVTLGRGDRVVFAKLNIINPGTIKVSVLCELRVGTEVDRYEMFEIQGPSMRFASLIVGANLATGMTQAQIVVKRFPTSAPINIANLVIASIEVDDLTIIKTP